jgi:triosephosphate isomerase
MRTPLIAGNWKLFKTIGDTVAFVNEFAPLVKDVQGVDIVIAPVFTSLPAAADALKGTNVRLSAQNCFWEREGAFTGEVSPPLLLDAGCSHVIIGHSERRQYFGETDATVNRKMRAALASGLTVLFCIGETLAEREDNRTFDVLRTQLAGGLEALSETELQRLVVAYEPVWAIGTGKTASEQQAQEAHAFIRSTLAELCGQDVAEATRILYGGSVKPDNVAGLMAQPDIDGALVGGASLKPDSFAAIVRYGC